MVATDPMEPFYRAQLIKLEVDELTREAESCTDLDRIKAIREEVEVRYQALVEIRREQLMEHIAPPAKPKRSWWRCLFGGSDAR